MCSVRRDSRIIRPSWSRQGYFWLIHPNATLMLQPCLHLSIDPSGAFSRFSEITVHQIWDLECWRFSMSLIFFRLHARAGNWILQLVLSLVYNQIQQKWWSFRRHVTHEFSRHVRRSSLTQISKRLSFIFVAWMRINLHLLLDGAKVDFPLISSNRNHWFLSLSHIRNRISIVNKIKHRVNGLVSNFHHVRVINVNIPEN